MPHGYHHERCLVGDVYSLYTLYALLFPPVLVCWAPAGQIFIKRGKKKKVTLLNTITAVTVIVTCINGVCVHSRRVQIQPRDRAALENTTNQQNNSLYPKIRVRGISGSSEYLSAWWLWRYLQISTHFSSLIITANVIFCLLSNLLFPSLSISWIIYSITHFLLLYSSINSITSAWTLQTGSSSWASWSGRWRYRSSRRAYSAVRAAQAVESSLGSTVVVEGIREGEMPWGVCSVLVKETTILVPEGMVRGQVGRGFE